MWFPLNILILGNLWYDLICIYIFKLNTKEAINHINSHRLSCLVILEHDSTSGCESMLSKDINDKLWVGIFRDTFNADNFRIIVDVTKMRKIRLCMWYIRVLWTSLSELECSVIKLLGSSLTWGAESHKSLITLIWLCH